MNPTGSTIANVAALAFGVAFATTIFSRKTTAPIVDAGGNAGAKIILATLGIDAVSKKKK